MSTVCEKLSPRVSKRIYYYQICSVDPIDTIYRYIHVAIPKDGNTP